MPTKLVKSATKVKSENFSLSIRIPRIKITKVAQPLTSETVVRSN